MKNKVKKNLYFHLSECHDRRSPLAVIKDDLMTVITDDAVETVKVGIKIPHNNRLILKLEHLTRYNPTGSMYDRFYDFLFDYYERKGLLFSKDTQILEGSVGNAGAAFVKTTIERGYHNYTIILPEDLHGSRIDQIRKLGARVIESEEQVEEKGGKLLFSPPDIGEIGHVRLIEKIVKRDAQNKGRLGKDSTRIFPMTKVRGHGIYNPPYAEVIRETLYGLSRIGLHERIDNFVFGVGSGNTLSETGLALKRIFGKNVRVTCCDFAEYPLVFNLKKGKLVDFTPGWIYDSIGEAGQGVPPKRLNLRLDIIDDALLIDVNERAEGRRMSNEALPLYAGRPTGLMIAAAMRIAKQVSNKNIFTIIFDSVSKYKESYVPLYDIDFSTGQAITEDEYSMAFNPSAISGLQTDTIQHAQHF